MQYKIIKTSFATWLERICDNNIVTSIPMVAGNSDYQEYLAWLADGNEPERVDPPVITEDTPTLQEKVDALELVVGMLLEDDDV